MIRKPRKATDQFVVANKDSYDGRNRYAGLPPGAVPEHRVGVRGGVRNDLEHISVFDNFAVLIEAEYVYSGVIVVSRPLLETMQNNEIILGYRGLNCTRFRGYSFAIRVKYSMNPCLPSGTPGLC